MNSCCGSAGSLCCCETGVMWMALCSHWVIIAFVPVVTRCTRCRHNTTAVNRVSWVTLACITSGVAGGLVQRDVFSMIA